MADHPQLDDAGSLSTRSDRDRSLFRSAHGPAVPVSQLGLSRWPREISCHSRLRGKLQGLSLSGRGGGQSTVVPSLAAGAAAAEAKEVRVVDCVPELLDAARSEEYLDAYLPEYQPVGPTEHAIVRELARHAAAMDLWSAAGDAVERQGARELPDLALGAGHDDSTFSDAVLAGTMSQEVVHRCEKQLRCRSRAFCRALGKLEELQARRRKRESEDLVIPPNPFTTEVACENYLVERFKSGKCRCPRCGAVEGHHIASRRCWECAKCGSQAGVRHGTLMADSPIPLTRWFTAIWLRLWRPTITTAELVSNLGITRIMTVRTMASRIRAAMAAQNASDLLAELDTYYAKFQAASPESSAREKSELRGDEHEGPTIGHDRPSPVAPED